MRVELQEWMGSDVSIALPVGKDSSFTVDRVGFNLIRKMDRPSFWLVTSRRNSTKYVGVGFYLSGERIKTVLHRVLMNAPKGVTVDHRNRNGLDNRMDNLRLASQTENNFNTKIPRHNTSGVKGVSWHPTKKKWRAVIQVDGVSCHLGMFDDVKDAIAARRTAERRVLS